MVHVADQLSQTTGGSLTFAYLLDPAPGPDGGMGETVTVDLPVTAVVADADKSATVWIVDEDTMTVSAKSVKTGLLTSNSISVSGLEPGERVVTAGAAFMREGMKVTLLQTGEQPDQQPDPLVPASC